MTRVFTDGAEMRDTLFWNSAAGMTVVSANPVPFASAYCYKLSGLYVSTSKYFSAIDECYLRARLYMESYGGGLPVFRYGENNLAYMTIDSSGHPAVVIGGATVETATETITYSQWYLFEIHYKLADAGGRFEVKMDGVQILDYTGDTKPSTETTFDNISYQPAYFLGQSVTIAIDDLAMNDVNGASDNSWCGDGIVIKVIPDGNGAHNDWHGSDGDSADNYLLVQEYPHDGNTTYVYHDGAESGVQDQYTLSDYDGASKTIQRIYPEARARKTAAAAHTLKLGTLASGGTDYMSDGINLTTNFARAVGKDQVVNPVDSNPWEEADIDALQLVLEVG